MIVHNLNMTKQEKNIVDNIANKLAILLYKNKITILMLSKLLYIDKQPLYRIMKREHIPNIFFLERIASYLNCSVAELIDDKFFLDIKVFNDLNMDLKKHNKNYRVYIHDINFNDKIDYQFFGVLHKSSIKIFYKVEKIVTDGFYIYTDNNVLKEINVISAGTTVILALENSKEIRLNPHELKVNAKLYRTVSIIEHEGYAKQII